MYFWYAIESRLLGIKFAMFLCCFLFNVIVILWYNDHVVCFCFFSIVSVCACVCIIMLITFRVSHRQWEMYVGQVDLCVCLSVFSLSVSPSPHAHTSPRTRIRCLLVVHYWADLQSVHGFRCCDNSAARIGSWCTWQRSSKRERSASAYLYLLYAWLVIYFRF